MSKSVEIGRQEWGSDHLVAGAVPAGGFIFSCWVRAIDPGPPPWSRGNVEILNVVSTNKWIVRGIVANGSSNDGTDGGYNANLMWHAYKSPNYDWAGDVAYTTETGLTDALANGWVWVAWQMVWSTTGATFRQWLKFGIDGAIRGPFATTKTLTQLREDLVSTAGWTSGEAAAWTPDADAEQIRIGTQFDNGNCYVTRARVHALTTEPTTAYLNAIAERDGLDQDAWADWELIWSGGAAILDNREGTAARDLTIQSGGTLYEGLDGPTFPVETVTGGGSAETGTATASGTGTATVTGSGIATHILTGAATAFGAGAQQVTGIGAASTGAATAQGYGLADDGVTYGSGAASTGAATALGAGSLNVTGSAAASTGAPAASGAGVVGATADPPVSPGDEATVFEVTAAAPVINWAPATETEEILQNVRFILGSVAGRVPLARGMGVDSAAVDGPASKARALLMTSVVRAIQRNEPRARVVEIYVDDLDALNGQFSPRVRIAL